MLGFAIACVGTVICFYGYVKLGGGKQFVKNNFSRSVNPESNRADLALAGGVFCIITGILGMLSAKYKSPFFVAPFMTFSITIGIFMIVLTVLITLG